MQALASSELESRTARIDLGGSGELGLNGGVGGVLLVAVLAKLVVLLRLCRFHGVNMGRAEKNLAEARQTLVLFCSRSELCKASN